MQQRTLGTNGLEVSALGFGCMGINQSYGRPLSRADGIAIIRAAVDSGVTFFDTAEVYGPYANEDLVGEALEPVRDQVATATKFGFNIEDGKIAGLNSHPSQIRSVADASLKRLDTDVMNAAEGSLIAKAGAEGFYALGYRKNGRGFGLAFKIADGNNDRARTAVLLRALKDLGLLGDERIGALAADHLPEIQTRRKTRAGFVTTRFSLA